MAESKFSIGDKSKTLLTQVLDFTTDRRKFPVKFRNLIDAIQKCALSIHCDALSANGITTNTQKRKDDRYDLQTSVVSNCEILLSLIEISLRKGLISAATGETWSGLTTDIKYMTLAWRNKSS